MSRKDEEESVVVEVEVNLGEEEVEENTQEEEGAPDEEDDEILTCKYCEYRTYEIDQLEEHILSHEEALLEEREVDAEYGDAEAIEGEEDLPETSQDVPQVEEINLFGSDEDIQLTYIFVCPYKECDFQTEQRRAMSLHFTDTHCLATYLPEYICGECHRYTSKRRSDMQKHLLTHTENIEAIRFFCESCPYATKRKSDLTKHKIVHSKSLDDLLTCHVCGYTSRRMQDLKKHMVIHDSDDVREQVELHCTECGYTSKRLNDLNKHIILHSDREIKGILKCLNCPYMTTQNSSFAKHVLNYCKYVENGATILEASGDEQYVVLEEDNFALFNNYQEDHNSKTVSEAELAVDQIQPRRSSRAPKKDHLKRMMEECEMDLGPPEKKVLVLSGFNEGQGNVIV